MNISAGQERRVAETSVVSASVPSAGRGLMGQNKHRDRDGCQAATLDCCMELESAKHASDRHTHEGCTAWGNTERFRFILKSAQPARAAVGSCGQHHSESTRQGGPRAAHLSQIERLEDIDAVQRRGHEQRGDLRVEVQFLWLLHAAVHEQQLWRDLLEPRAAREAPRAHG